MTDVKNKDEIYLFPGIDYSNARVADFIDVENYMTEAIERTKPRMPWHDIHSMIEGPAVLDIARHFVERWNFVKAYTNTVGITNIQTQYIKKETLRKKQTNKEDLINKPQQLDRENNEIDLSKIDEENNFDEVQKMPTFKRPAIEKTRTDYFRTQKTIIQDKISLKQKLINKLELIEKCKVEAEYFVDAALLGGLIVEMDGKILYGSLRHRLYEVKEVINT